jgi:hypothetical protein
MGFDPFEEKVTTRYQGQVEKSESEEIDGRPLLFERVMKLLARIVRRIAAGGLSQMSSKKKIRAS